MTRLVTANYRAARKRLHSQESQINRYYQVNMQNPTEFEIESTSTSEKSDEIEREDETTEAIPYG
jgi:hypothetical protein